MIDVNNSGKEGRISGCLYDLQFPMLFFTYQNQFHMKKILFIQQSRSIVGIIFLLLNSFFAGAQNIPACDSLYISCCTYDTLGPNTITIYASNYSSVLFDYPSFVLFNLNMDTIAKETVTYFGISQGPQPHTLDIVAPLILPFNGYLNLYTLFDVTLDCSFPFYIPDTVNRVQELQGKNKLEVYPNPAEQFMEIKIEPGMTDGIVLIYNLLGDLVVQPQTVNFKEPVRVDVHSLPPAIYRLEVRSEEKIYEAKFVKR